MEPPMSTAIDTAERERWEKENVAEPLRREWGGGGRERSGDSRRARQRALIFCAGRVTILP